MIKGDSEEMNENEFDDLMVLWVLTNKIKVLILQKLVFLKLEDAIEWYNQFPTYRVCKVYENTSEDSLLRIYFVEYTGNYKKEKKAQRLPKSAAFIVLRLGQFGTGTTEISSFFIPIGATRVLAPHISLEPRFG